MVDFGWSYPPGCDGPPYDDERRCQSCGEWTDDCICEECSECGCHPCMCPQDEDYEFLPFERGGSLMGNLER